MNARPILRIFRFGIVAANLLALGFVALLLDSLPRTSTIMLPCLRAAQQRLDILTIFRRLLARSRQRIFEQRQTAMQVIEYLQGILTFAICEVGDSLIEPAETSGFAIA